MIASHSLLNNVNTSRVEPHLHLSDHALLRTSLQCSYRNINSCERNSKLEPGYGKYVWNEQSPRHFRNAFSDKSVADIHSDFLIKSYPTGKIGSRQIISDFYKVIRAASAKSLVFRHSCRRKFSTPKQKNKNKRSKEWFDKRCRNLRSEMCSAKWLREY